ncbi:MAG: hypothetical protein Q3993_06415 [Filifactor alocis]|nr:hypothetical protein [Filifactor alocis]
MYALFKKDVTVFWECEIKEKKILPKALVLVVIIFRLILKDSPFTSPSSIAFILFFMVSYSSLYERAAQDKLLLLSLPLERYKVVVRPLASSLVIATLSFLLSTGIALLFNDANALSPDLTREALLFFVMYGAQTGLCSLFMFYVSERTFYTISSLNIFVILALFRLLSCAELPFLLGACFLSIVWIGIGLAGAYNMIGE